MRLAAARDRLARLHHFADAPSEAYFNSYWSRAEVDNLLEQIARHADLYKRYQRLRAEQVKKITGSKEVNLWDMSVRATGMQPPRYNIAEASWIAVGMTSLEDWHLFTWSFGCTSRSPSRLPPSSSLARFAITSLALVLVEVPEPVW